MPDPLPILRRDLPIPEKCMEERRNLTEGEAEAWRCGFEFRAHLEDFKYRENAPWNEIAKLHTTIQKLNDQLLAALKSIEEQDEKLIELRTRCASLRRIVVQSKLRGSKK